MSKAYWLSWYTTAEHGGWELHSPWWISGYSGDGEETIIVAAVRANSPEEAEEVVVNSYDTPPEYLRFRFNDEFDRSPFSDRFPQAEWMAWDDDRTCNCGAHDGD